MDDIAEEIAKERRRQAIRNQMRHLESQIYQDRACIAKVMQAVDHLCHAMNGVRFMQGDQLSNVRSLCVKGIDPDAELLGKLKLVRDDMLSELNSARNNLTAQEERLQANCRAAQRRYNSLCNELYWD